MRYKDLDRILHNKKASKTTIGKGEPSQREGSDGDITIREVTGKGIFLFVKYNNNWYSRVLFDGAAEIGMQNPGRTMQLFGWNPDSKAYQLLNASEVFELNYGSPGKLTLGSGSTDLEFTNPDGSKSKLVGRKSTDSGAGSAIDGTITTGEDNSTNKEGILHLGSGTSNLGGIITGRTDFSASTMGLRVTGPTSANTAMQPLLSAVPVTAISGTDKGVKLSIYNGSAGAISLAVSSDSDNPTGLANMGTIWVDESEKLSYRYGTGTIYDLTTASTLSSYLPLAGGTVTGTVHMDDDVKIEFGDAGEYIKGDGTDLHIASSNDILFTGTDLDCGNMRILDANRITFNAGGSVNNVLDEDNMASDSNLGVPTQQSVKAYVDTNRRWHQHTAGYKFNNNSNTTYYFQYRYGDHNWSNSEASPTSMTIFDSYASIFIAPYAGTLDKISIHGYASDTGVTDPLKFYVYKATPSTGTSISLTQIGVTGTITPVSGRIFLENTAISSSNTFAQHDCLYVMYKKDSTSGSQDLYFSVTISGVYTA